MFQNGDIIITNNSNKLTILKNNQDLKYLKIYTLAEFNRLYYFDYDVKTISYIMNKYQVICEIAQIYLNNLIYIEDKKYLNSKLNFLSSLKKDLISQNLLIKNQLFKAFLNNKHITFYDVTNTKEKQLLFNQLSQNNEVTDYQIPLQKYEHSIYELNNLEQEVIFIANKICSLVKEGISLKNIYVTNLTPEYRKSIKRIFPMFNIPFTLTETESIYGTFLVSEFLNNYQEDLTVPLNKVKQMIKTLEDEDIYNKLLNIVNKYIILDNPSQILELIKYDLKNTLLNNREIVNSVHEKSLKETIFTSADYVFLPSFNQGIIPYTYKDEEYLNDEARAELNISLTVDQNAIAKQVLVDKITSINNLIISYKLKSEGEEYTISNLNEVLNYEIIKNPSPNYIYSNLYNEIRLTELKDEYYKYGTTNEELFILDKHYHDFPYHSYKHDFTGLNQQDFLAYLNNKLTLSYTSLDKYFRCPFSYYVGNILKLNIFEETFYQKIGTLFHSILEKYNNSNLTYDELWEQEKTNLHYQFSPQELFFLRKLKKELLFIIETIKEQDSYSSLKKELHEESITVPIAGPIPINFTGIIDKIKYNEQDDSTTVAIIDYKTGNPDLSLANLPYGLGMQLPIYLFLAKNSPKFKNIKVAGFYLQKILHNEITVDKYSTYKQAKKKNLLLQGISNENQSILSQFDNTYIDSKVIKSMKVKNDNTFYSFSKVLSTTQMEYLITLTSQKIKEGATAICNAEFKIAPKKIGKLNKGCEYCQFKDLCFHTTDDIEELPELTENDIFGGDNNGMD